MTKRLKDVVQDTQQEITTTVERDGDDLVVEVRASTDLDEELRSEFSDKVDALGTDEISVRHQTYRSNQGNELAEDVTVRFGAQNKLQAIDVIDEIVELGKDYHSRQLERELGRADETSTWHHNQQLYFDDEEVKEFCLLYRGSIDTS